jgi:hypothetical protein
MDSIGKRIRPGNVTEVDRFRCGGTAKTDPHGGIILAREAEQSESALAESSIRSCRIEYPNAGAVQAQAVYTKSATTAIAKSS